MRAKLNKNTCLVKTKHQFLWHKWITEHYNHDWSYITRKSRICSRCGRTELLFGISYCSGGIFEDWRKRV